MKLQLENQERKLDDLLRRIEKVEDDELKAHLSKYFCIKISGYLENVVKTLVANYSEGASQKPIVNYIQQDLKNITNLSDEKIRKLLMKFSEEWNTNFSNTITEQQIVSLNSIISNRNSIAHGQQDNVSPKVITQYYSDLKAIVQILKLTIRK